VCHHIPKFMPVLVFDIHFQVLDIMSMYDITVAEPWAEQGR
jgi:hypothetical protein